MTTWCSCAGSCHLERSGPAPALGMVVCHTLVKKPRWSAVSEKCIVHQAKKSEEFITTLHTGSSSCSLQVHFAQVVPCAHSADLPQGPECFGQWHPLHNVFRSHLLPLELAPVEAPCTSTGVLTEPHHRAEADALTAQRETTEITQHATETRSHKFTLFKKTLQGPTVSKVTGPPLKLNLKSNKYTSIIICYKQIVLTQK